MSAERNAEINVYSGAGYEAIELGTQLRSLIGGTAILLAFCASLCGAQAPIERRSPAQKATDQTSTLVLESRLVTVAVNAVDDKGSPVGGLDKPDFRLLEDGKEQKIAFFDKESATPLSIVLAIDASGSTQTSQRLEKEAAKKFVQSLLREQDELDLMEFSDNVREIVAFTPDKRRIADGLNELHHGDATALYDAIYLASQRLGETSQSNGRRRVLVLITDGGDTTHGTQYPQALEQAQRAGVIIYSLIVIPIWADAGRNTGGEHALMQLSEDTGGKFYFIQESRDLAPAFAKVSDDLRTQYTLGYYAPQKTPQSRSDGFRTIKVEVTDPAASDKISLRYRTGYYAAK
jgi:Ca-activated chloride channel family protein